MVKPKQHPHATFLNRLSVAVGGRRKLLDYVEKKTGKRPTRQAMSMWLRPGRGIAGGYRLLFADLARTHAIKLPSGFQRAP